MVKYSISERRACKIIGQPRTTQKYIKKQNFRKEYFRPLVIAKAEDYGRYGYRQVNHLLNNEGHDVGKNLVYDIWREEGLKVPQKQPKRRRLREEGYGLLMGAV